MGEYDRTPQIIYNASPAIKIYNLTVNRVLNSVIFLSLCGGPCRWPGMRGSAGGGGGGGAAPWLTPVGGTWEAAAEEVAVLLSGGVDSSAALLGGEALRRAEHSAPPARLVAPRRS